MADLLTDTKLDDEQHLCGNHKRIGRSVISYYQRRSRFFKDRSRKADLAPRTFDLERCVHEILLMLQGKARKNVIY